MGSGDHLLPEKGCRTPTPTSKSSSLTTAMEPHFSTYYLQLVESNAPPPRCDCRPSLEAKLRESNSSENPGRRFFNCPLSLISPYACKFFKWVDPELSKHYLQYVKRMLLGTENAKLAKTVAEREQEIMRLNQLLVSEREAAATKISDLETDLMMYHDLLELERGDVKKLKKILKMMLVNGFILTVAVWVGFRWST